MEKIKPYFHWIFIIGWIVFLFKDLLLNITTNLLDWNDPPYLAWQIYMLRDKILSFNLLDFSTLNTHYPYKLSVFFSDSLFGQSIMAIPFFFIKNPILLYNLLFLLTIVLNYVAGFILFKYIFKERKAGLVATFFLNNSFFFFDQLNHLQMLSYWPTLLMLYFLLKGVSAKEKPINVLVCAVLLGVQFYFSIYLGIFAICILVLFSITKISWLLLIEKKLSLLASLVLKFLFIAIVSGIIIMPLYMQYNLFEKIYHQTRDLNEILMNSTHITDFLFFTPDTLLNKLPPIAKYQQFNRHLADELIRFPGIILTVLTFLAIFANNGKKNQKKSTLTFENTYSYLDWFFLSILLIGFIFSLGPRLNANGQYLEIPLPYQLFINKIFVFSSIRQVHRWFLLSLIALAYFAAKKVKVFNSYLVIAIMIFFIFESVPYSLKSEKLSYLDSGHYYLKQKASPQDTLIEFPFLNMEKGIPISYETRILLASTFHGLKLFNGYTGLFIDDWNVTKITFENFFPNKHTLSLLKSLEIKYLKLNKQYLETVKIKEIKSIFKEQIVFENKDTIIFKFSPNLQVNKANKQINKIKVKFIKDNPLTFGENDDLVYLRLNYVNHQKITIANLEQKMAKIEFKFYYQNKLTKRKTYYDPYSLFIYGLSQTEHLIKFKETVNYDQVEVLLYSKIDSHKVIEKLVVDKLI